MMKINRVSSLRSEKSWKGFKKKKSSGGSGSGSDGSSRRKDKQRGKSSKHEKDKKTPVISNANRKQYVDDSKIHEMGSTSNLFLQMADNEVGNHISVATNSTEQISDESPSPARIAALGGMKFHPAVGGDSRDRSSSRGGSSYASTTDNDEEEYSPSTFSTPTKAARHLKDAPRNKSSPTSVIPEENRPRRQKKKAGKGRRRRPRGDSSYYDSETQTTNESAANYRHAAENSGGCEGAVGGLKGGVAGLNSAQGLFGTGLEKIYDFIFEGKACWSGGKDIVGRIDAVQNGCADVLDELGDVPSIGSEGGSTWEGTDGGSTWEGTEGGSTWDGTEEELSLEYEARKKNRRKREKKSSKQKRRELNEQQDSWSFASSRRGRSRTAKHSYNSDGESIRRSSLSGSRGASLSLSTRNSSASLPASGRSRSQGKATGGKLALGRRQEDESLASSRHEQSTSAESVVENVLTQDQEAWMAMTKEASQSMLSGPTTTTVQASNSWSDLGDVKDGESPDWALFPDDVFQERDFAQFAPGDYDGMEDTQVAAPNAVADETDSPVEAPNAADMTDSQVVDHQRRAERSKSAALKRRERRDKRRMMKG